MYKQRTIVLIRYPFSDFSQFKLRPVLVVSNDSYNQTFPDILLCGITSNLYQDEYSVAIGNADLLSGFLPRISVVKCHILHSIDTSLVVKEVGILREVKFIEVTDKIRQLTEMQNMNDNI